MKKRIFGIILSMIMVVSIVPASVIIAGAETNARSESREREHFELRDARRNAIKELSKIVGNSKNEELLRFYNYAVSSINKQISVESIDSQKNFWTYKLTETKVKIEKAENSKNVLVTIKSLACIELRQLVYGTRNEVTKQLESVYKRATEEINRQKSEEDVQIVKDKWKKRIISDQMKNRLNNMSPKELATAAVNKVKTTTELIVDKVVKNDDDKLLKPENDANNENTKDSDNEISKDENE